MESVIARAEALAQRRVADVAATLAVRLDALPGVTAEARGENVVLTGPRLSRRRLDDARLRWPAELLR